MKWSFLYTDCMHWVLYREIFDPSPLQSSFGQHRLVNICHPSDSNSIVCRCIPKYHSAQSDWNGKAQPLTHKRSTLLQSCCVSLLEVFTSPREHMTCTVSG